MPYSFYFYYSKKTLGESTFVELLSCKFLLTEGQDLIGYMDYPDTDSLRKGQRGCDWFI